MHRRITNLLRAHHNKKKVAVRAIGRSGGIMDEEFAHLCEPVCEHVEEAKAKIGDKRTQKVCKVQNKELACEVLREQQL